MLRVLIIALVMLVAALLLMPRTPDPRARVEVATLLDAPRELPAVTLVDQHGAGMTLGDLAGRPAFVFFGFTNCPDICPLTLAVLAEAVSRISDADPAQAPAVLFVSVDPARDSPDRIRAYLGGFDDGFLGATADEATIAPLLESLSVSVHRETRGGETYNVVHNGTIYVLDSAARWAAIFGGQSHRADIIVSDYLAMRPAL